ACTAVERRQLEIRHLPEPGHVSGRLDTAPATCAHDPQLAVYRSRDPLQVLARLQRPDGEDVVAVGPRAFRGEDVLDGVRHYPDRGLWDGEQVDELALRELRHGDQPVRGVDDARHSESRVAPAPAAEPLWVAQHGEVMHGDDERRPGTKRGPERRTVEDV